MDNSGPNKKLELEEFDGSQIMDKNKVKQLKSLDDTDDLGFEKGAFKAFNQTVNVDSDLAKNLFLDDEDRDENNDADPEDLNYFKNVEDMNKTLDDVFTLQMFGYRDVNEKIIPFDSRKAGLFERMLHPIQYGSLRGSIFALSSMCLDSGALVFANRCQQFGMVNFVIFLVIGGIMAYWSLVMMIKAARNMKERDYSKVVKATLGNKIGVFLDCNICLYIFGLLISFQVIIFQLIGSLAHDIYLIFGENKGLSFKEFNETYWQKPIIVFPVMFGVVLLVLPLCLLKDVSKMRFASLFGVMALVYSIIVIVIESPIFFIKKDFYKRVSEMNLFNMSSCFNKSTNFAFFSGVATVFYAYSCHAGAFPVYKTLRNNTTRRIKKVFRRSIMLDAVLYISSSVASYLTSPFEVDDLIVYRESLATFKHDYFMILAKVGIIFDLFFSTPANFAAFRISVFELVWGNTNMTGLKNLLVTVISLAVITLIGASYSDILSYISLLGGFCSVIYCFLIPGLIYVKNNRKNSGFSFENFLTVAIVALLTFIGYTSGILTIIFDIVGVGKSKE